MMFSLCAGEMCADNSSDDPPCDAVSPGLLGFGVRAWAAEVAETVTIMTADADDDIADLPLAQIHRATEDFLLRIVQELAGGDYDVEIRRVIRSTNAIESLLGGMSGSPPEAARAYPG